MEPSTSNAFIFVLENVAFEAENEFSSQSFSEDFVYFNNNFQSENDVDNVFKFFKNYFIKVKIMKLANEKANIRNLLRLDILGITL